MATYLIVNLSSVIVPFAFSFHKRLNFYKNWYAFWPAAMITAAVFLAWDIYFTHLGVWGFNPEHLIRLDFLGLPLEEWLFFICIPYACVFTYACLKKLIVKDYLSGITNKVTWLLSGVLLVAGAIHIDKAYTSVTFLATALFLLVHLLWLRSAYLSRFYLAYALLLFPFLLVNGILTGSFIDSEVVWYNNAENLGLRILSIPIEDFVYALLLILMNVTIYETILSKRSELLK